VDDFIIRPYNIVALLPSLVANCMYTVAPRSWAKRALFSFVFTVFLLWTGERACAQQVHVLSLDDAINTALGRGEEISLAKAGVRAAEGGEDVARSGMLPQLSASATYVRTLKSQYSGLSSSSSTNDSSTKGIASLFKNLPFGRENQWQLGLNLSQAIFTGGRLSAQSDAAEARKRVADIDLTAAEAQLVLNVTQSYYDAALADTLLIISRNALAEAEEVNRQTELQYQVGAKAEFDALRARVAMENQVPAVLQAENDRTQAQYRLKQLLNIPLDDSLALTTPVVDSVTRFAMRSDTATEQRSSVVQAGQGVEAAKAQVRIAQSARWPQIYLSSTYSPVAYPDQFIPNNNDWLFNWTAAVNLSLPLYTGGNISGNVEMAQAGVEQAAARLEQAREAAAMDSRVSLDLLRTAEANLRATSGTADAARRAYEIANVRFAQGISTQLELNDARLQEEQARANWARAVRNYQVARAKLALLKDLPVNPAQAPITNSAAQSAVTQQSFSSQPNQGMTAPAGNTSSPSVQPTGQ
jgi:outer membrane protein